MKKLIACLFGLILSVPAFAALPQAAINAGYTEVEYLQSNGSQYINTDVGLNEINKITGKLSFNSLGTLNYIAGARSLNNTAVGYAMYSSSHSGFTMYNAAWPNQGATISANQVLEFESLMESSNQSLVVNGNTVVNADASLSSYLSSSNKISLFALGQGEYMASAKIYYIKMYHSDTLVRDFVPVKNSSGVYGMYNVLDNNPETAFYGNKGSGSFTGGDPVNTCPNGQVLQTYTSATGTVTQNGTPTPDAPVEPVFYKQGNMVLRAVGYGNNIVADTYDATTGKITRNVGSYTFTGEESFTTSTAYGQALLISTWASAKGANINIAPISNYFLGQPTTNVSQEEGTVFYNSSNHLYFRTTLSAADFKAWLAERYNAGTPLVVYFARTTATTEDWAAEQCVAPIKIATVKYNNAAFSTLVSGLTDAINTIKNVVSNTINQTAAVASLQSGKQTMPDSTATNGTCPNYKQCLLVEDSSGVPHWYVITDPFRDFVTPIVTNSVNGWDYIGNAGYTQLEYLQFVTGVQNATNSTYIDTGIYLTNNHTIKVKVNTDNNTGNFYGVMGRYNTSNNTTSFQFFNSSFRFGTDRLSNSINGYLGQTVTLSFGQNGLFVNDTLIATPAQQTFTLPLTCLIGSVGSSDSNFGGKIYEAWIELNGAVIAHYVPARRESDGVLGMYDLTDSNPATAFHTNAGTGTFTAGNPVANPDPALPTTPTWTVAWAPDSDYAGSVNGTAKCNNSSSDATATTAGSNCWCRVTSILVDGTTTNVDGAWAFRTGSGWTDSCVAECATSCAAGVYNNATFRRTVFGM